MTKAMRWGVSSLFIVGGLALGGFAGCSEEESPPPVTDTDSGTTPPPDTAKPDTGTPETPVTPETGTETATEAAPPDTPVDAPPPAADRAITLLFAAPDQTPTYVCLGAFLGTADPSKEATPVSSQGPIGRPDPTAPTDPKKFTPLGYGALVPLPLNAAAIGALESLKVVLYLVPTNPLNETPAATCATKWASVKDDPTKWKAVDPKSIVKGDSALVTMAGCVGGPTATGKCGTAGKNFEFIVSKLDTKKPTFPAGGTGPQVGVQFFNLSQFPGSGVAGSGFGGVDVYILPMNPAPATPPDAGVDEAGAPIDGGPAKPTPAGAPIKIATDSKYKDLATASVPVQLAGKPEEALLIVLKTGTAFCVSGGAPTAACLGWTLPFRAFVAGYAPVGGGFIDKTNQVFGLAGSPAPETAGDPASASLRIPMGTASKH